MTVFLSGFVRLYQLLARPFYRQDRCRFYPSCSDYALEALAVHGPARGLWLAARRLGRCHPWNPGGVDHVPPRIPATRPSDSSMPAAAGADWGLDVVDASGQPPKVQVGGSGA